MHVFERSDRLVLQPAGAGGGGDDQDPAIEAAGAFQFRQREARLRLGVVGGAQADIGADRLARGAAGRGRDVRGAGALVHEALAGAAQVVPGDQRAGAGGALRLGRGPGAGRVGDVDRRLQPVDQRDRAADQRAVDRRDQQRQERRHPRRRGRPALRDPQRRPRRRLQPPGEQRPQAQQRQRQPRGGEQGADVEHALDRGHAHQLAGGVLPVGRAPERRGEPRGGERAQRLARAAGAADVGLGQLQPAPGPAHGDRDPGAEREGDPGQQRLERPGPRDQRGREGRRAGRQPRRHNQPGEPVEAPAPIIPTRGGARARLAVQSTFRSRPARAWVGGVGGAQVCGAQVFGAQVGGPLLAGPRDAGMRVDAVRIDGVRRGGARLDGARPKGARGARGGAAERRVGAVRWGRHGGAPAGAGGARRPSLDGAVAGGQRPPPRRGAAAARPRPGAQPSSPNRR